MGTVSFSRRAEVSPARCARRRRRDAGAGAANVPIARLRRRRPHEVERRGRPGRLDVLGDHRVVGAEDPLVDHRLAHERRGEAAQARPHRHRLRCNNNRCAWNSQSPGTISADINKSSEEVQHAERRVRGVVRGALGARRGAAVEDSDAVEVIDVLFQEEVADGRDGPLAVAEAPDVGLGVEGPLHAARGGDGALPEGKAHPVWGKGACQRRNGGTGAGRGGVDLMRRRACRGPCSRRGGRAPAASRRSCGRPPAGGVGERERLSRGTRHRGGARGARSTPGPGAAPSSWGRAVRL